MAYKADYRPAELLCPTSLEWHDFDGPLRARMAASGGRLLSLADDSQPQGAFSDLFQDEEKTAAEIVARGKHRAVLCMAFNKILPICTLLQAIDPAYTAELEQQMSTWMASCGPAATEMIYKCN